MRLLSSQQNFYFDGFCTCKTQIHRFFTTGPFSLKNLTHASFLIPVHLVYPNLPRAA